MFESADDIISSPGYLLMKAGTHIHTDIDASLASVGLTGREFLVLTFVGAEALSQQELSERLGLDPTVVVGLVDGLEQRRLLDRNRDPADRRRYILSLTPEGRRTGSEAKQAVSRSEAEFLAALNETERAELSRALLRIMRSRLPWLPQE